MEKVVVVQVKILGDGVLTPEDLPHLVRRVSEVVSEGGSEAIVISGRLPVWAFCALTHHFHPRPLVATFEPRMGKGVCIASHTPEVSVGDLIPVDDAEIVDIEYLPLHLQ